MTPYQKKLILSLAAAFFSFVMIFLFMKNKEKKLLELSELQEIVFSSQEILAQEMITEKKLEKKKVPRKFVQPQSYSRIQDLVGQVALVPIQKGEQIVGTKILNPAVDNFLSRKIPIGYRAISIATNEVHGVAQLIQPNDFIDILVTFDFGNQTQSRKYTYTLFEKIQVLAVQQEMGSGFSFSKEKKPTDYLHATPSPTVTLALKAEDIPRLVLAQEGGQITLSLRSSLSSEDILSPEPITPAELTGLKSLLKQNRKPAYLEYKGSY